MIDTTPGATAPSTSTKNKSIIINTSNNYHSNINEPSFSIAYSLGSQLELEKDSSNINSHNNNNDNSDADNAAITNDNAKSAAKSTADTTNVGDPRSGVMVRGTSKVTPKSEAFYQLTHVANLRFEFCLLLHVWGVSCLFSVCGTSMLNRLSSSAFGEKMSELHKINTTTANTANSANDTQT